MVAFVRRLCVALVLLVGCVACGTDSRVGDGAADAGVTPDDTPSGPDAGTTADAATTPPEGGDVAAPPPALDAGAGEAGGRPVPTNLDFDSARPIQSGDSVFVDVVAAYQESYFSFEGKAGDYVELMTEVGTFTPDNVLALYDAERALVAENDLGSIWPGDRVDARLVVRLPRDGTYYVKAVDPTLPPEVFASPSFVAAYFHLSFRVLVPGAPGVAFAGSARPVEFVVDPATTYRYVTLVGELTAGQEVTVPFDGLLGQALIGTVLPSGIHGNGSTALGGVADVTDADGHVLAGIDRAKGQTGIHPPITAGAFAFNVSPTGELGDNAFFAVDLVMLKDNPREQADSANDVLTGAEPVAMGGSFFRRGLLLATVDGPDVDYFSFPVAAGEHIAVACEGESAGSGVRTLHAEVRDASEQVLASEVETPVQNLYIPSVEAPEAGMLYLRLSTDFTTPFAVSPWVRCVVTAGP